MERIEAIDEEILESFFKKEVVQIDEIELTEEEFQAISEMTENELNELDKKTLASYVKKAASNNVAIGHDMKTVSTAIDAGSKHFNHSEKRYDALKNKARKREKGISRAVKKLTKESTEDKKANE